MSVASREVLRPEHEEDANFMEELRTVRADRNVDPLGIIVFDEMNGTFFPEVRRVQAAPSEFKGKQQTKTRRRCRRKMGGRASFTVCVVYSLGSKGKLLFLLERASAQMLSNIRKLTGPPDTCTTHSRSRRSAKNCNLSTI